MKIISDKFQIELTYYELEEFYEAYKMRMKDILLKEKTIFALNNNFEVLMHLAFVLGKKPDLEKFHKELECLEQQLKREKEKQQ